MARVGVLNSVSGRFSVAAVNDYALTSCRIGKWVIVVEDALAPTKLLKLAS